jgi:uncharacterized protein
MHSLFKYLATFLIAASFASASFALDQSGPSMSEIYSTAQAGKLDEAQVMVQQVLISHPKSAKAFFVQAELYSRQGNFSRAKESLSMAEKYAPGLPFAKPEAVQALRAQLAPKPTSKLGSGSANSYVAPQTQSTASISWFFPLLLVGGVIVAAYFFFRKRNAEACSESPAHPVPNGLSGPQTFGSGVGAMQPAYPQSGYTGYPQPHAEPGLGSRIAGGVATGLAVGAGVMAAEAIGRNLMGSSNRSAAQTDMFNSNKLEPLPTNTDMGGQNFGVNDTTRWRLRVLDATPEGKRHNLHENRDHPVKPSCWSGQAGP